MSIRKASISTTNNSFSVNRPAIGGLTVPFIQQIIYTDSSYNTLDDIAVSTTGGYVRILGYGFTSSMSMYLNGTQVSSSNITYVSASEYRALLPAASAGYYSLMMFATSNNGYVSPNLVLYSPFPTYSTPTALILINNVSVNQSLTVTGDNPFTFYLVSGTIPTGLTLSSAGVLSGTVSGYSSNTSDSFVVGIDDVQYQSITQTITWTVLVNDQNFPNNTLLLSANTSIQTSSFVSDNSNNNLQLTVFGDTRAQSFHPYQPGYYSNYFDGNGDYLSIASNSAFTFGTGDFTIEFWFYGPSQTNTFFYDNRGGAGAAYPHITTGSSTSGLRWGPTSTSGSIIIGNNQWNHCAVTRQSGTVKLWVNGVLDTSVADSTNYSTDYAVLIGNNSYASNFLTGYVSNFRVVKGTAVYTAAFTPSTTPLLPITGTSMLTCQANRLIDNSSNNFSVTKNGDTTVKSAHPFTTKYVAGTQYYSTYFDGTSSSGLSSVTTTTALGSSDFTIEFWVKTTDYTTQTNDRRIISQGASSSTTALNVSILPSTTSIGGISQPAGTIYFAGSNYLIGTNASVADGSWHHVAFVRQSGTTYCYLDGVSKQSISTVYNYTSTSAYSIGYYGTGGAGTGTWNGYISNLRIIVGTALYQSGTTFTPPTSPLTAISGTTLLTCQSANMVDNSSSNLIFTQIGTAVKPLALSPFTPSSYTGTTIPTTYGSAYFDGTGDYLTVPYSSSWFPSTTSWTIEFWFYSTSAVTGNQGLFRTSTIGWPGIAIVLGNGSLYIDMSTNGTAFNYSTGSKAITQNTWNHVALVRNGGTTTAYLNGTSYYSASSVTVYDGNSPLYLGYDAANTPYYYYGYMTDVRIIKGTALYTSNFVPGFITQLTNVTNTQLLTLQSNGSHNTSTFQDNSSFNNLITRDGDTNAGTFSPYGDNFSTYVSSGNYYTLASSTVLTASTTTFTIEAWIFMTSEPVSSGNVPGIVIADSTGVTNYLSFGVYNTTRYLGLYWFDTTGRAASGSTTLNLYTWYHIACSVGSNTIKLFVNGTSDTLTGTTTLTNRGGVSGVYQVGNYNGNTAYFTGYISNVRIISGTSLYSSNFTAPTSALTAVSGTSVLLSSTSRFVDLSFNNWTLTSVGSISIQKFSPFSTITVPKYYSYKFDGTGDYISTLSSTALGLGVSDFTIELWFNTTAKTNNYPVVVSNGNFGANKWQIDDRHATDSPTKLIFGLYNANSAASNWLASTTSIQNNTWYHVAIVRSGNTFTMYLNGVAESTNTYSGSVDGGTAQTVYIAQDAGQAGTNYNGIVSNLRITKGLAVYTGTFTPPTNILATTQSAGTNINAITGTQVSLLTCQSSTIIDNSTNYLILSGFADSKPLAVSPFTPTVNTTPLSYSPATFGGSYYFDGTGDSLYTSTITKFGYLDHTIEVWVYFGQVSSRACILTQGWGTGSYATDGGWTIDVAGSTAGTINLALATSSGGSGAFWLTSLGSFSVNKWYHIAMVRSSTSVKIYSNGVQIGSGSLASSSTLMSNMGILRAGMYDNTTFPFTGYMSDIRVSSGALYTNNFYPSSSPLISTTTIGSTTYYSTLLINGTSGAIIDGTRSIDLQTLGDSKAVNGVGPYNGNYYSVLFNGSSDYFTISNNSAFDMSTGNFTIEAWVNILSFANIQSIISVFPSSSTITGYTFAISTSGFLSFDTWVTGNEQYITTTNNALTLGQWYHVAVTNSFGTYRVFVNGVICTYSSGPITQAVTSGGNSIKIGYQGYTAALYPLNGYISNLRVIKGTAVYTSAFTPSTSPLTAISGTSLLTCQSNKFVDNSSNTFTLTTAGTPKVQSSNPFQVNTGLSYYFDGTGDYLTTRTSTMFGLGTGTFTVECWIYATSNPANGPGTIIDCRSGILAEGWVIRIQNDLRVNFYDGPNNSTALSTGTVSLNVWQYITVVRSSTSANGFAFYINGIASGTGTVSGNLGTTWVPKIGSNNTANYDFNGYISDFRITLGVTRYTTTFVPSTIPSLLF